MHQKKKKKETEIPGVVKYYKETKRSNNNLTQEKLWYKKNFFDAATYQELIFEDSK